MVTTVGTQNDIFNALGNLVELEFDVLESCDAALNRLESDSFKKKLDDIKNSHQERIATLSNFLKQNNKEVPDGPSAKSYITQGKVVLANLVNDQAIMRAVQSNESDAVTAYERFNQRYDVPQEIRSYLDKALSDEKRNIETLKQSLDNAEKGAGIMNSSTGSSGVGNSATGTPGVGTSATGATEKGAQGWQSEKVGDATTDVIGNRTKEEEWDE